MTTNEMIKLVERAAKRDNEAMEQLYSECYKEVYFVCKKYSLNDADAEDVTQDTFIQAFSKLSTLDNGGKFKAWVTRIASNKCLDLLKHNNVLTIDSLSNEDEELVDIPDAGKQTEEIVVENEVREIILGMMEKLPVEQRVTLFMYYYQNYSIKEIALAYGCSENTVKSRLNYAKKTMRGEAEKLEDKGIKLRVVAVLPFLYTIYQSEMVAFACQIPDCTALLSKVMEGYMTGGIETVSKVGIVKGLGVKIAVGVIGAVAIIGGVIAAMTLGGDDNSKMEATKAPSNIVSESPADSEDITNEDDKETDNQENTEPDKRLIEFMKNYENYVNEQVACKLFGSLSLHCNNEAKGSVEQILSEKCDMRYNLFSTGTLTLSTGGDMDDQYNKFVTYGTDGQLYLYEKKEKDSVDGKDRPIESLSYNKYTRTPVDKLNLGQLWLDFVNENISNPTVRDVEENGSTNLSFTITLSGEELVEILKYTSIIEHANFYLQYSTDKRFVDYTFDVKIIMTINDFYNNEIIVTSDEFVEDLIKAYAIKDGNGNGDNYTLSEDEDNYWQQIRMKYQFFDYEDEVYFYYPRYIDVEASGNNLLIDLYDQKDSHYVLLPQEIPGYEFYASDLLNTKFVGVSGGDVTKRIVIDDMIGISGKYGMEMSEEVFRFVSHPNVSSDDFVVNNTTIGDHKVYYILNQGFLDESERTDNAMFLYAQVEFDVSEADGDVGYVCVVIEYTGKDGLPPTDGMLETLTHIVEDMEYVHLDGHYAKIK